MRTSVTAMLSRKTLPWVTGEGRGGKAQGQGAKIPSWKLHPLVQIFFREGLWRLEQDLGWALPHGRWIPLW